MKKGERYFFSADVIRTLAIIGVVAIHTANSVFERPDFFGGISWWFAIIIDSISRICIPLFIMLSGFLLIKKDEAFKVTLGRVVNRLAIPLVFWTTIIYITENFKNAYTVFSLSFLLNFFSGNVYYFYFIIILIGLYLASPIFIAFLKNKSISSQKNLAVALIIIGILETAVEYLSKSCASENSFTKWVPYAGVFILGYLIATSRWKFKNQKSIRSIYLIGFISTIALNYFYYSAGSIKVLRTLPTSCLTHYSDYYLSWNVTLMSISAFAILFHLSYKKIQDSVIGKVVYKISRASFGIYLVNLFVVNFWDKWLHLDVDGVRIPLWSYVVIKLVAVFIISFAISSILVKIPIVKLVMGEAKKNT